jgi:hypothetical protein
MLQSQVAPLFQVIGDLGAGEQTRPGGGRFQGQGRAGRQLAYTHNGRLVGRIGSEIMPDAAGCLYEKLRRRAVQPARVGQPGDGQRPFPSNTQRLDGRRQQTQTGRGR